MTVTKAPLPSANNQESITCLQNLIDHSRSIVFFGGAGVSTESGIPDFRSVDGLYNEKYPYPPEEILSYHFFVENSNQFFEFYRDKLLYLDAQPNKAHQKLAQLEQAGKLAAVITQNIDGLHQMAGSQNVLELHGSVHRNFCQKCRKSFDARFMQQSQGVPTCSCGGIVKPDVILYEEALDDQILWKSQQYIQQADLLMIGGTSLAVYPAAGLINYYSGDKLVVINKSPTLFDRRASLLLQGNIGDILDQVKVSK
ncbi:MAG TPA: NAD-dependent protein deacylase [Peptococcaceae bacterium]|nr:NAD-dependent protein deacylase [Peptococcaceae bacterium]